MENLGIEGQWLCFFTPILIVIAGLLMVSRVRYFSFKAWPTGDRVPFVWIIVAVVIIIALTLNTALVLLALTLVYALSGVVITLWGLRSRASRRRLRAARRHAPPPELHP
jgi:CDP-diacylglycerol--serine O-phosphatidyltransferase